MATRNKMIASISEMSVQVPLPCGFSYFTSLEIDYKLFTCSHMQSIISEKDIRRVQRAAERLLKQQEAKRSAEAQEIARKLQEIDVRYQDIVDTGAAIESRLKQGKPFAVKLHSLVWIILD